MYIVNMKDVINNVNKRDKVCEFLNKHDIKDLDEEILKNMSIIYYNDIILGTLSFEKFCNVGLIRYFVYVQDVDVVDVIKLFKNVCNKAIEEGCNSLMAFCLESEENIFVSLGFKHIEESLVYIEEESFLNSKYNQRKTYLFSI